MVHFNLLTIFLVCAGDPALTGTAIMNVTVTDVNDNPPTIEYLPGYPAVVPYAPPQGQLFFCFAATDPDSVGSDQFTFAFNCTSTDYCGHFTLRLATGKTRNVFFSVSNETIFCLV